ncbi:MAG: phosphoglycolate phosphatase [Hyphomicrobiaceae bacterium]
MSGVIFDLDGTLVESAPAMRDVANQLMIELDLQPLKIDEVKRFVGAGTPVFLQRALQARGYNADAETFEHHVERLKSLYAEAPGEANYPMKGAGQTLRRLCELGYKIGLCTNKWMVPTQVILAAHGWEQLISVVVAGDSLTKRKPDPAPLREAAKRLATTPVVYVGDSDIDAAAADAAEIPFILFTEGYLASEPSSLRHAASFASYDELPELISDVLTARATTPCPSV